MLHLRTSSIRVESLLRFCVANGWLPLLEQSPPAHPPPLVMSEEDNGRKPESGRSSRVMGVVVHFRQEKINFELKHSFQTFPGPLVSPLYVRVAWC